MTTPPHDLAAERVILGSLMLDGSRVDEVARRITAESFWSVQNATIFRTLLAAHEAGDPTEPTVIAARLSNSGDLPRIGGAGYLFELIQAVGVPASVAWYADRVATAALARGLEIVGTHAQDLAHTVALDNPAEAVARVQAELDGLTITPDATEPRIWRELVGEGLTSIEAAAEPDSDVSAISTGLPDLDDALGGGMRPGQVVVIGGRTSMGKSVLARNIVRATAFRSKLPTLLFTLEMTGIEVFECIVAAELGLNLTAVQQGALTDGEWARIARFAGESADVPLFVDDTAGIGLAEIRAKARTIKKRYGLDVVVVDYLQLVEGVGRENRQVIVSALSRGFKVFAQEFGVLVILCAQLNRGPEMRADKRPNIADLRESGSVENDANVVILVHREEYYVKDSPRRGEADLIVAKNRSGRLEDVVVAAQLHHSRFVSFAKP